MKVSPTTFNYSTCRQNVIWAFVSLGSSESLHNYKLVWMYLQTRVQYTLYCSTIGVHCLQQLPCWWLWTPHNGYLHCTDDVLWSHSPGWSWSRPIMDWTCLLPLLYPLPCSPIKWCFPTPIPPMEGKLTHYFDNQLYHFHVLLNIPCWTDLHRLILASCVTHVPQSTYFTTWETNFIHSHGPSFTSQQVTTGVNT